MNKKIEFIVQGNRWCVDARDEADVSVFNEIFKLHEYRIADDVIRQAVYPIVDVGAHAGFFSMHARSLNKKVKIFAVEPEPENIRALEQHVRENNITGVTVVKAALGLSSGSGKLIVTPDSHNHRLALGFEDQKTLVPVTVLSFADLLAQHKITKVSLLKMDIEGGEYDVFAGMSRADFAMVNYVILEYHEGREKSIEIEQQLRENGFSVQVFPSKFDKTMGFMYGRNKRKVV
jgi:FkbM family methyltransferase